MWRKQFLVLALALMTIPRMAGADIPGPLRKNCEAKVDQAMQAYNAKNWKAFFKDFAAVVSEICSEQSFHTLYVNLAQRDFGLYQSRSLDEARSAFSPAAGLLIYKARFSKKPATLSVNFLQEGGDWKIQQLRIDP